MLNLKEKYKWKKEGDRYRICNIPIFRTFQDKIRGKVDKAIADEIMKNFRYGIESGYYPRTHIGHQNLASFDNKPGVGFLDNLQFDGENFYADIAEIDEKTFCDMKNYKYPYRSVEYNPSEKKIEGLALLESVPPYFQFPILALESEQFSNNRKKNLLILFQGDDMADEEKEPKDPIDEPIEDAPADEPIEDAPIEPIEAVPEPPAMEGNPVLQKIEAMLPALEKMLEFFEDFQDEGLQNELEEEPMEEPMEEEEMAQEPLAMQKYNERIEKLEKELLQFKKIANTDAVLDKLRSVCEENPRINFAQESAFIEKFESNKDKLHYVNRLAMQESNPIMEHKITQFAKSFKVESKNDVLQKFSKEDGEVQNIAKKAYIDYTDSINQKNEREAMTFSKRFPTAESYINFAIEMEKMDLGYNPKYK
jgi:hypothetical protein